MNRNKLKQYAPQARRDFIAAVTDRAAHYGLTKQHIQPITKQGDVALVGGNPFPRHVAEKRKSLEGHIKQRGFEQVMEAMAYTWFNRLVAIRFMELHGYLDHGYRVLSHPEGKPTPEILEHAEYVELPGLKKEMVIDLKLAGNKEGELYRLLLTAQCNALHTAMPFLFEKIDDETELLLPDNLLHSDSLIRKLVREIDEEDWKEVEIIGWLYQFYIAEKKDQVIGKVVASEDIPAATQLFTPNWIVKYLVQNTLGRQWLATYPQSTLRQQMEYYIEPAEQTPEVQEQLKAITPTSLNPEELTLLDPACGSGHILVEAYDLFKAIYQERGYRARDIPALILQKNLFGLEIDDRAAQLAAFALMMKARADDRRIIHSEAKPNILAFQDSRGMDAADITHALNAPINTEDVPSEYLFEEIEEEKAGLFSRKALAEKGHVSQGDIASLLGLFESAKTFGSLIQVPPKLAAKLPEIEKRLDDVLKHGDLTHASAHVLKPLLQQARLLAGQYDSVVANPPYMGSKFCNDTIKTFLNTAYKPGKGDLYAAFVIRNLASCPQHAYVGMITIPNWMAHPTFAGFRDALFSTCTIDTFVHNGRGVWGSDFGSCSFTLRKLICPTFRSHFKRLFSQEGSVATAEQLQRRFFDSRPHICSSGDFEYIPGKPLAYWIGEQLKTVFKAFPRINEVASTGSGLQTSDNPRFLRHWFEIAWQKVGIGFKTRNDAQQSRKKWFPHKKGGEYRKWYGNNDFVVNWENDGHELFAFASSLYGSATRIIKNVDRYFQPGVTWSHTSIARFSARQMEPGFIFNVEGPSLFASDPDVFLAYLCSTPCFEFMKVMNPTLHFLAGSVALLPCCDLTEGGIGERARQLSQEAVAIARRDWNSFETSWDFQTIPVVDQKASTLRQSQEAADAEYLTSFIKMKELEEKNNRLFIEAFGLQEELSPEVPEDQITLYRPDREEDIKRLISYAIGCMMGRYSLDKPGLIYAHSGNQGFDPVQYKTFRPDDDGIIPLFETDWGIRDDATHRIVEFIGVAWPKEHLEENLKFIADSLGPNHGEQPRETIRRYLTTGFSKHHLSMYKKRPIYWLFSSGKHRAFQCLVYLHRYNEGALARMRTEYVIPLQGKMSSRIGQLADDIAAASSTSHRKKLEKERDTLGKHQAKLYTFDEKLRHYADRRISLDLDDGVRVNYGKFGDLLAEVKAVTGGTMDVES